MQVMAFALEFLHTPHNPMGSAMLPITEFPDVFMHLLYFDIIQFDLLSALIG